MGAMSIWHWLLLAGVVFLLFGRGKLSEVMGDAAKGIKAFKKGMSEEETVAKEALDTKTAAPTETTEKVKV